MYKASRIQLYDRCDNPLPELSPADVFGRVLVEEINGEHSLTIVTTRVIEDGTRAVTRDGTGKWHEWVLDEPDELHASGGSMMGTYRFVWSIQSDLQGVYGAELRPGLQNPVAASVALAAALNGTSRWSVGTVDVTSTGGLSMYDNSAWQRLSDLIDVFGGEVDAEIAVDSTGVISRHVALRAHLGSTNVTRRFDWTRDLRSIRRKPMPGPRFCRVIPRGKGEEIESSTGDVAYGRRINIKSVNGGVEYLRDTDAELAFRLPNGSGGYEYPRTIVIYEDIEDPQELKDKALADLHLYTRPMPTYEADVLQLAQAGMDVQGISVGDDVHVVDAGFADGVALRLEGRVLRIETDEISGSMMITIGRLSNTIADSLYGLESGIQSLVERTNVLEAGGTSEYLRALIQRLNEEINATDGYSYVVPGEGIVTYNIAVDDPLIGYNSATGQWASQVTQIKGGSIRIANTRNDDFAGIDDWNWKSVFVAGLVASDVLTASNIVTGTLQDASGNNSWNLDTGVMHIASSSTVGGRTVQSMLNELDSAETEIGDTLHSQQTIWRSAPSGTLTMQSNTTWVNNTQNAQGEWTTTRPTYDPAYPVLFVAMQRRTRYQYGDNGGRVCSCSTPVRDETTTVIDGGHISTGTIDANRVNVTNLDASEIVTGTIRDRQNENYWNMDTGEFSLSGTSVEVGGAQYLDGTSDFAGWRRVTTAWSISEEIATCDSRSRSGTPTDVIKSPMAALWYKTVRGYHMTLSFEAISDAVASSGLTRLITVSFALVTADTNATRKAYINKKFTLSSAWKRYSCTLDMKDSDFTRVNIPSSQSLTGYFLEVWVYNSARQKMRIRKLKLERGDVATDWCSSDADLRKYSKDVSVAEARAIDTALNQEKIFNRLTANGTKKAIVRDSRGNLYLNGAYIQANTIKGELITAGIITDKKGKVKWNLGTGAFTTTNMTAKDSTLSGKLTSVGKTDKLCSDIIVHTAHTTSDFTFPETGAKFTYADKGDSRKLVIANGVIAAYATMNKKSGTNGPRAKLLGTEDVLLASIDMLSTQKVTQKFTVGSTSTSGATLDGMYAFYDEAIGNALRLYSRDVMRIVTPALYVSHSGSRSAGGTKTLCQTIRLRNIMYKSGGQQKTGTVSLKFIHGMLVSVSGPAELVEKKTNEYAWIRTVSTT